jgi:hypothetical protein
MRSAGPTTPSMLRELPALSRQDAAPTDADLMWDPAKRENNGRSWMSYWVVSQK